MAYVAAAIGERRRGRGWPLWRAEAWLAGLAAAGLGFAGPLAHAAHDGFVALFHQLLGWHRFYDRATADIGLISDRLLHAGELFCAVAGTFLVLDARRRPAFSSRAAWAGFLVGAGAFQLWDGLVNHKLLRLHQIRYDVDLVPYDIAWFAAALVLWARGSLPR